MANNCCATVYVDGGTWNNITLINPDIKGGVLESVTMTGGVTLDTTTSAALATQICSDLAPCIQKKVDGGTFTGVTLSAPKLTSAAITGGTITGGTLVGPTTIKGQVPLDSVALAHLCTQLGPCIDDKVDDSVAATVTPSYIAGVFHDCAGAPRAPGVKLPSCADMTAAIELAVAELPALDIVTGFSYDTTTQLLTLATELSNGTPQKWAVHIETGGSGGITEVVVDKVTIAGDGTAAAPLHVIMAKTTTIKAVTTGTALPTNIHGSRAALLGQPDAWVNIGGYLFPAYTPPTA